MADVSPQPEQGLPAPAGSGRASARRFKVGSVDLLAGAMWLAIALAIGLVVTRGLPFTGGKSHHSGAELVAQPTQAATVLPSATAPATAAPATPAPPLLANVVSNAGLLRPGASLIERIDLAPAGTGRTSIVYSSAAGVDGCQHPYVDVLRTAADGSWKPVWAATTSPLANGPLIPAVNRTDAGCFPRVSLLAVRGLDTGHAGLALGTVEADGAQRVVVIDLAGVPAPTVLASLNLAPGIALTAADTSPLALEAIEPLRAPATVGGGAWSGQTVARLSQRFAWRGGTLSGDGWVATPTCLDGTVATRTADATPVIVVRCADGDRYAAVQLSAETIIPEGLRPDDLQAGDDVQIALAQPTAGAAPPTLPVAARVDTAAAQNRALIAAAATPAPTPAPIVTAPPRSPAPTRAPAQPTTSAPAPAAVVTSVAAPTVVVPVATRPPVVATAPPAATPPPTEAPARTVPPQPTSPAPVRTVPPQPQ